MGCNNLSFAWSGKRSAFLSNTSAHHYLTRQVILYKKAYAHFLFPEIHNSTKADSEKEIALDLNHTFNM